MCILASMIAFETNPRFKLAIQKIDEANAQDPNRESTEGEEFPKELLYAQRMTSFLSKFYPEASEELHLAARAQHICRWQIPRKDFPMNLRGYNDWRRALRKFHSAKISSLLTEVGYEASTIERVQFLVEKKQLKRDAESQTLEDVVCLVFMRYYFDSFANKYADEKVVDILKKTWKKMSPKGHQALLALNISTKAQELLHKAQS